MFSSSGNARSIMSSNSYSPQLNTAALETMFGTFTALGVSLYYESVG